MQQMEKRLQQCLPYLAKSLGKLVMNSDNPDLQTHACQLMSCELDSLQQEVEFRLQASPQLSWQILTSAQPCFKMRYSRDFCPHEFPLSMTFHSLSVSCA